MFVFYSVALGTQPFQVLENTSLMTMIVDRLVSQSTPPICKFNIKFLLSQIQFIQVLGASPPGVMPPPKVLKSYRKWDLGLSGLFRSVAAV